MAQFLRAQFHFHMECLGRKVFLLSIFFLLRMKKMRNEITSFWKGEYESLFDAWERFKELCRQCPCHGITICIQLETFHKGLVLLSRKILDASPDGAFSSKSYEEWYKLIGSINSNIYQWPITQETNMVVQNKPVDIHEVTKTTYLATQVAQIH